MKNKLIFILGLIIGMMLSSICVYAATLYEATEVAYDNSSSGTSNTDVQSALDELYGKANRPIPTGNATASDVKKGVTFWNVNSQKQETGTYEVQQRYIKYLGSVNTTTKNNAVLTFNVKNVDSNYAKYTTSDFVNTVATYYLKYGDCIFRVNSSNWSYNSSTGILTITLNSSHNYIETVSYSISIYVLAYK